MTDHNPANQRDRNPAGPIWWFIPLLGLIALVLFASQCVSGTDATHDDDHAAEVTTTHATEEPEPTTTTQAPSSETPPTMWANVVEALRETGGYSTFTTALDASGLTEQLSGGGPFTLLAPSDEAFTSALGGADNVDTLLSSPDILRRVMSAHIVEGEARSADFAGLGELVSLEGAAHALDTTADGFTIGSVAVTTPDLASDNGVVHGIDGVLVPEGVDLDTLFASRPGGFGAVATENGFDTMADLLAATGLGATLDDGGPYTVFAPTNEAFAGLPEATQSAIQAQPDLAGEVLRVHVVEGLFDSGAVAGLSELTTIRGDVLEVAVDADTITVGGAPLISGDVAADNGLIHVVDGVIVPKGIAIPGLTINQAIDLEPINFEVGSAVITADGQAVLDRAVEFLVANPVALEIGGHTDSDGDDAFNLQLSQDRADAVVQYLADNGVDGSLLTAIGYGETQPVAPNDTDEGKAENRRIEFKVLGG